MHGERGNAVRGGEGNEAARIALMAAHARALDAQVEELITCRTVIGNKITAYRRALETRGLALLSGACTAAQAPERGTA
jgi:hypothetical protein